MGRALAIHWTNGRRLRLTLCGALLLLAWLLDWRVFGVSELGQDGFLSVDLGFAPLGEMLSFTVHDVHPPLFYAMLHGWFALAGISYATAKFVPLACGVLALAVAERLGARLAGPWTGLLGAALLALSPTYLRLSATVRDFIPGLLFSLVTVWLTMFLLSAKRPRRQRFVVQGALALLTAAALLTSYFQLGVLAAEALVLWWARHSRATGRPGEANNSAGRRELGDPAAPAATFLSLMIGVILALPWYAYFLPGLVTKLRSGTTGYVSAPKAPTPSAALNALTDAVTGAAATPRTALAAAAWFAALALGVIFLLLSRGPRAHGAVHTTEPDKRRLLSPLAGGEAGAAAPGEGSPLPLSRVALCACLLLSALEVALVLWRWQQSSSLATYILVLLPFTALLQASVVTRGTIPLRVGAGVLLVGAVGVQLSWYASLVRGTPIDFTRDQPLQYLASTVRAGDGLIFSDHARRGQYLLIANWEAQNPAAAGLHTAPLTNGGCNHGVACAVIMTSDISESYLHATPAEARRIAQAVAAHARRIWYAESGEPAGATPVGLVALNDAAYPATRQPMAATIVWLFLTTPPDTQIQPSVTLGRSVTLTTAAYTSHAMPGGAVMVQLVWRDLLPLSADYTVFVHLDSLSGHLAAQSDGPPVTGLRLTTSWRPGDIIDDRHAILLPPNIPAGQYHLDVGLYRGDQRLALPDGNNTVRLGVVQVGDANSGKLPGDT